MLQEFGEGDRERPKILAIDDTPTNLLVLERALSAEFTVQLATSGTQGLEMASADPPALILLDIMMPDLDGYETCSRLKADPRLTQIPVVFVTALSDSGSEVRGLKLGAADYLYKPINVDIMRQRIRNLVERETLRKELEQHRERLEQLVALRTEELVRALDAAEAANRTKSAFLANMSHELRTPLGVMLGMNYLLQQRLSDAQLKEKCAKIAQSGEQLKDMIEEILQVSRMDVERSAHACVAFSPEVLLASVAEHFSAQAQNKGLAISREVDANLPKLLFGAPERIKQTLERLVSNAIKFSSQGTIRLRVLPWVAPDGSRKVQFEVADQGVGIEPVQLDKLFKLFSQVDDSPTREYGGLGLGLFLCQHLAHAMGGEIGVESVFGQGSCFWLRFSVTPGGILEAEGSNANANDSTGV